MIKKIVVMILSAFILVGFLSGCGTTAKSENVSAVTKTVVKTAAPSVPTIYGHWVSKNKSGTMTADITANTIKITLFYDGASALYWNGIYTPTNVKTSASGQTIRSAPSPAGTNNSEIASDASEQDVTLVGNTLIVPVLYEGSVVNVQFTK